MAASTIVISQNGTDISDHILISQSRFQALANAVPGTFEIVCKDLTQELSFTTGDEITLDVDGRRLYGGYVMEVGRTHAFDADNTDDEDAYQNRLWRISGVDYNVLFDKRVIRDTGDYLSNDFATFAGSEYDGDLLTELLDNYIDVPAGFNTSFYMDNVAQPVPSGTGTGLYRQQGTKLREQFTNFAQWSGAVWYISPNKNFHWHSLESIESRWGFSDQPNNDTITSDPGFQDAYYGFREVAGTEDGSPIVNDALIWGGGVFAGSGGTTFAREENTASETAHGRWQVAETHFGEPGYGGGGGEDARASAIVNGPPGADALGQLKGLRYSQWDFRFAWHAKDVPLISGVPDHLTVGDLVHIQMNTFDITKLLPLRSLTITFPTNDVTGETHVRFDGEFSLNIDDPFTLWKYLLNRQKDTRTDVVATSGGGTTTTVYGALYHGVPTPDPDGVTSVFAIPFAYIATTIEVYVNGLLQEPNDNYTESDPAAGEFTLDFAPDTDDELFVIARTLNP